MSWNDSVPPGGCDVVLLHGWGTNAGVWDELGAALARDFQVLAVDLAGFSKSPSGKRWCLQTLADALAHEMPRSCHVVGWSLGALIALAWAQCAPSQVSRLALVSATPCFSRRDDWPHGVAPQLLRDFGERLGSDCAGTLTRFAALQALGDVAARQVARRLKRHAPALDEANLQTLRGGLRILLETDLRDALATLRQPTLVLHGDRDRVIPEAAGRYLGRHIPGARFELIAGAAHAPFVSKLSTLSRLLREFFGG